jgi:uncharacterized ion transporter superfamily protein YfcC
MRTGKIRLPHTLVLIYAMVILTVVATWIVPGGQYQRVEKDGRTVPVAGTFALTNRNPQGLGALFISPVKGFIDAIAIVVVMRYAGRVQRNPRQSPTYEDDLERREKLQLNLSPTEMVHLTPAHKRVLVLFLAGMALLVFGILRFKWYINEIAGLFLALGVFSGFVGRLKAEDMARSFVDGAKDMVNAALIIGCARAILVVATDGRILDTTLYSMSRAIAHVHPVLSAQMMFISQCIINFFVHSGTAQAALTMPIMAPLGELVGITRQTSVFAFQLAEYINPILPTSGVTMGVLGLAQLRWEKWAKWLLPLVVIWVIFGLLTLIPPVLMRWGPF